MPSKNYIFKVIGCLTTRKQELIRLIILEKYYIDKRKTRLHMAMAIDTKKNQKELRHDLHSPSFIHKILISIQNPQATPKKNHNSCTLCFKSKKSIQNAKKFKDEQIDLQHHKNSQH